MKVNGKTIEKEINLGTEYQSPQDAKEAVAKWLKEKNITNYSINLERVKSTNEAKRAERPLPNTNLKVGDRVVADLRKEKNYPTDQQYVSGFVTRVGEKGVHIEPDNGGEIEWHPYKIVKKLGESKQRLDPKCWKGYRKAGTKMKGGKRVNNCVPVSEDVESIIGSLIAILESK